MSLLGFFAALVLPLVVVTAAALWSKASAKTIMWMAVAQSTLGSLGQSFALGLGWWAKLETHTFLLMSAVFLGVTLGLLIAHIVRGIPQLRRRWFAQS